MSLNETETTVAALVAGIHERETRVHMLLVENERLRREAAAYLAHWEGSQQDNDRLKAELRAAHGLKG